MSAAATTPTATTTSTAAASSPGATTTPVADGATSPASPSPVATPSTPAASAGASQKLVAVAYYTLDPSTKHHRLRPTVSSSTSGSARDILAASPSAASDHTSHGVVAAFNAATDLVMYLDEQLSRPPSAGETLTGLFRPASAELGGRLKKLGEKVERGKTKVPVGQGGEAWEGERRVVGLSWEEFGKVFGTA